MYTFWNTFIIKALKPYITVECIFKIIIKAVTLDRGEKIKSLDVWNFKKKF